MALVSGGYSQASTDVYLPLDLPLRTLQALRSGQSTPRGTIQSVWTLENPSNCHARGLSYEEIQQYSPDGSGLLVARKVLPHGPSDSHVEEADILRTVDDQIVTSLPLFEQLMDGAVGNTLKVQVQRHGNTLEYELQVQDLWTLTPCRLLEYSGSNFQDLRFQTAFDYNVPIEGVVLHDAEDPFILEGSGEKIIRSLNNRSTKNLDAFIEVARGIPGECRSYPCENCRMRLYDQTKPVLLSNIRSSAMVPDYGINVSLLTVGGCAKRWFFEIVKMMISPLGIPQTLDPHHPPPLCHDKLCLPSL